ncbi:hypothetical protein NERG_00714 [Nematocida ausubeli]|uniref:Uncharacterized protein n=1 Tax=Nematocida ausubeli (strain ATCC PRA-371 / ERTm2) TaxID=1913371 RepID=H8ZAW5_NEMA1|nr:hypothetical protein NERG_00714 [Nematocida ausubeli]
MVYLSWLTKTPNIEELGGFEEYIKREKEESVRIMKRRLKKGKTTDRQIAEDTLGAANKLYAKGDFLGAINKIKEALTYHSTNDNAYYLLGVIYEEQEEAEKAFNAFLISASIKRTDITLWKRLYEYKRREDDLEYQVYILKKIKKLKPTNEVLEDLLEIYERQKNQSKIFEIKAEMMGPEFPAEIIFEILENIRTLKNRVKIIEIISRALDREKVFADLSDRFIIGYVDLLFTQGHYSLLSQLNNSLQYCKKTVICIRSQIILFFSVIISEIMNKCQICTGNSLCTCRDTADIDASYNILIETSKKTAIINVIFNTEALSDPIHLHLTGYLIDILIKMRKYKLSVKLLLIINSHMDRILSQKDSLKSVNLIRDRILHESINIKKRIAFIYDRLKEYDKSIMHYKAILDGGYADTMQSVLEEVKMRISEIYKKTGNIDLALEYALQIQTATISTDLQREDLLFYTEIGCMHMRSLLYKAMHIYSDDKIAYDRSIRTYFIRSAQELVQFLLKNTFIFAKKKKKRSLQETDNTPAPEEQLISTKEFETDYDLLHGTSGLGKVFSNEVSEEISAGKKVYFDMLASLLGGLTVKEWHGIIYRYITALHYNGSNEAAILLLRKVLTSPVLRSLFEEYTFLLWLLIRISKDTKDIESLHWGITHMVRYYAHRAGVDAVSFYYLCYFLISQVPRFHRKSEYYKFQKNVQRNLRRKSLSRGAGAQNILTILCFSYMPSFIYTDTAARLEKYVEDSVILQANTPLLDIFRAIALSSLFLTHASSRKVVDRDRYIKKGIKILQEYTIYFKESHNHSENKVTVRSENGLIEYTVYVDIREDQTYAEDDPTEKLGLLQYNLARAFHQYKLYGLAENLYIESAKHTRNKELLSLLQINTFLLGKPLKVSVLQ